MLFIEGTQLAGKPIIRIDTQYTHLSVAKMCEILRNAHLILSMWYHFLNSETVSYNKQRNNGVTFCV